MLGSLALALAVAQGGAASRSPEPSLLERLDREMREVGERLRRAYVSVSVERGDGAIQELVCSGTLLDGEGRVAVPASGLLGAVRIFAHWQGRTFYAHRVLDDRELLESRQAPLSVVELVFDERDPAPPAPAFADAGSACPGDMVALVSNAHDFEGSLLFGTVSGIDRVTPAFPALKLLQTTVTAHRGTPGGVVGNRRGEVMGILLGGAELQWVETRIEFIGIPRGNAAVPGDAPPPSAGASLAGGLRAGRAAAGIEARSAREPGLSLVMPIGAARGMLADRRLAAPRLRPKPAGPGGLPYLGLFLREGVDDATRERLGLAKGEGLLVDEIVEASPAKAAGLARGDSILRIDGSPVARTDEFRERLVAAGARGFVEVERARGGEARTVRIDLDR